ncbi:ankyrin repeat domain-containing protein [Paenibacillus oryzisoli]|uniref:ankyrin repeat domain-containing protein n=1 Tax=Paenibacillus oryzisoli TaxID=1850517 RepID=UPI003D2A9405
MILLYVFLAVAAVAGITGIAQLDFGMAGISFALGLCIVGIILAFKRETKKTQQFIGWLKENKDAIYNERAEYAGVPISPYTILSQYQTVISLGVFTSTIPSRMLIRESGQSTAFQLGYSLFAVIFGWWGLPWGPIQTVRALISNAAGGYKITVHEMIHFGKARPKVKGMPPIVKAVYNNEFNKVIKLVDAGKDIHVKDSEGRSALLRAAENGNVEMFNYLVDHGANLQEKDKHGDTLLIRASVNGSGAVVKRLLELGSNPNDVNQDGDSALTHAASRGYTNVIGLLLEGKANPNLAHDHRLTPLMMAALFGETAAVKLLLAKGADPAITDGNGMAAEGYAERRGHQHIVELLRSAMESRQKVMA